MAEDAGFDMIINGMLTREILQDIVDLSYEKQKLFDDYVQLLDQNLDKVIKSSGINQQHHVSQLVAPRMEADLESNHS